MEVDHFISLGLARSLWDLEPGLEVNGRSNAEIIAALDHDDDKVYQPCAEAGASSKAIAGDIVHFEEQYESKLYPDTRRKIWIYRPPEHAEEPGLVVLQDGYGYLNPSGPVRATAVLDALITAKKIAPVAAVFISPGERFKVSQDEAILANQLQRSIEYDTCSDTYLSFLVDEIIPLVQQYAGRLSRNPARRLIGGISSGGICAFNAAWHGPEVFGRVLSHCGSYTNIRGGHNFPYLLRTTPRKPLRVFLQSGANDADILYGNWPLANQQMASALEFAGYDYRFEFGQGGHSLRHGGSLFADSLQWLLN